MPAADLLEELFAPVGGVTIRRMFGGLGILKQGIMFALVADDVLYFKADDLTAPKFEAEGLERWVYPSKTRQVAMPYWRAPERLLDERDEFVEWARAAFAAAQRRKLSQEAKKRGGPAKKAAGKAGVKSPTKRSASKAGSKAKKAAPKPKR